MNFANLDQLTIAGYVLLAMFLGGLLGLEREYADKPAGLRTHILVAGAAALFVALSGIAVTQFHVDLGDSVVRTDPIRIMQAVITGVSFLGAGTILRHGAAGGVEGLTTAASILVAAGLGICVALSQLVLAISVTILALIILRGVPYIERRLIRHK